MVGQDGRPLIGAVTPANNIGTGSAVSVGTLAGLPVYVESGLGNGPTAPILVANSDHCPVSLSPGAPVTLTLGEPSILGREVTVYGFVAFKAYPGAAANITVPAVPPLAARSTSSKSS
jgi:hypothetical protein